MLDYYAFLLLGSWAHSFEGFENTNPREQLGGERFHPSCSKLGLGDAIILPHHSTIFTGSITHPGEQQAVPLRVSSKGAHHYLERSSIQRSERDFGDLGTWVFFVGPWSTIPVLLERVTPPSWFIGALNQFGEKEGNIVIQICSVWRGYTSDLFLRLHLVPCSGSIYLSMKFQGIWMVQSSGSKYWAWQSSGGCSLDWGFSSLEEQILASGLETSGRASTCSDLSFCGVWCYLEVSFS